MGQPPPDEAGAGAASVGRLWLQLVEKEMRCKALESRLHSIERSRSWRLTAPLRNLAGRFRRTAVAGPGRPGLRPGAASGGTQAWQPVFLQSTAGMGVPREFGGHPDSPRCLVDVTELALQDLGAGVQRITRRWLSELLISPPAGYCIEPVRLSSEGGYVLARGFLADLLGFRPGELGEDRRLQPGPTDFFLGLDFCRDHAVALDDALAGLQAAGVPIVLLLPDMLPQQHPEWFPDGIARSFGAWLQVCADRADSVVCISHDSLQALRAALGERAQASTLRTVVVPLGADLPPSASALLPVRAAGATRLLMVGTVEPRKRYPQMLAAFEALRRMGDPVDLLVVGRRGWESDAFFQRLMRHPEAGRSLHWLADADDATLAAAYRDSDLLVMASAGEGYGLPIIEAAQAGCRLLLRDLPVFREVAGAAASYFSGDSGAELACAIQDATRHPVSPREPRSGKWPTWEHSAFMLKNETIGR